MKDETLEYEKFKPIVDTIETNESPAEFLGAGAESRVWRVSLASRNYAIKISQKNALNARDRIKDPTLMTKAKINAGVKALGIRGLEQFVAGSVEDTVAVYQFVDGIPLNGVSADYVDMVTSEQKDALSQTILEATEAGLAFDSLNPTGANAFYSPVDGFTLIDYSEAYWPLTYRENWSAAMRSIGPVALRAFA